MPCVLMETEPVELEAFAWDELEERYRNAMAAQDAAVKQADEEFGKMLTFFNVWAQTLTSDDNHRSTGRLKTRIEFVRQSENGLAEKVKHYDRVVKAFEVALALL